MYTLELSHYEATNNVIDCFSDCFNGYKEDCTHT